MDGALLNPCLLLAAALATVAALRTAFHRPAGGRTRPVGRALAREPVRPEGEREIRTW